MKLEEAMVYLLATCQHGMKTEQIASGDLAGAEYFCKFGV